MRCAKCEALLFRMTARALAGRVEIKCRRCGALNIFRAAEPSPERHGERLPGDAPCHASSAAKSAPQPSIAATPLR
ncbi:Com family DNA-binding transcriptional regulator [Bosea vestrisii]|uniref:Com family DNA-binding transcriptional regulator n=1 Tax=Bosea vestrisii TaxID=151416 RepID=A0ABW0H7X6_9HYPH